jgi:hypothetical protein
VGKITAFIKHKSEARARRDRLILKPIVPRMARLLWALKSVGLRRLITKLVHQVSDEEVQSFLLVFSIN